MSFSLPLPGRFFLDEFDESPPGFGLLRIDVPDTESVARDSERTLD